MVKYEKITLFDEFLVLLGPIICRLFTCSNEEKKGACSSPISMMTTHDCTCFGHLERHDKNRNDPISVALPKMAKASAIVTVASVFALKTLPSCIKNAIFR